MYKVKHGSLFSGIGGFDLAAQWMGWENMFHCEWNEFGQKILKHYWPNAEQFTDITKSDFTKYANRIDILTGGFPCQPYSTAGKRKGKEDERHLWPQMLRAIREVSPRYVVGENVRGLTNWNGGMVFDEVQADLEAEGYECLPFLLPACAVGAPHRRDRIWFIAHRNGSGLQAPRPKQQATRIKQYGKLDGDAAHASKQGLERRIGGPPVGTGLTRNSQTTVANAGNKGLQGSEINREPGGQWQGPEQFPTGLFRPNWQEFPTQSPLCNGNDGISERLDLTALSFSKWRTESIKAGGNAIVPQVAYEIFKAIETYEKL